MNKKICSNLLGAWHGRPPSCFRKKAAGAADPYHITQWRNFLQTFGFTKERENLTHCALCGYFSPISCNPALDLVL
jgi:hypothetical protein